MRPADGQADLIRYTIAPSEGALDLFGLYPDVAISLDGRRIAYNGFHPTRGTPQITLRSLDQLVGLPLRGTEGGSGPFLSPDGQWVGFLDAAGRTLRRVSILGGPPIEVTESTRRIFGASWGADDRIVFGTRGAGLFRVSVDGSETEELSTLDTEQRETGHLWPFVIPRANAVLFVSDTTQATFALTNGQLAALDLGTGTVKRLGLAGVSPRYVSTGHLVYAVEDGSVMAVPFDLRALEVVGNPVPVVEGVVMKGSGAANFSISDNGRLVYVLGEGGFGVQRTLVWVDRDGQEEAISARAQEYVYPRVSPDGTKITLDVRDQANDVWVWDIASETLDRLTTAPENDQYGIWTPNGDRIVFSSARNDGFNVYWKAADGTGAAERRTEGDAVQFVNAVTPDGTRAIVRTRVLGRENDLTVVTLTGERSTETLLSTEFDETNAALSPDGEWVAYQSDESGRFEVYVRPFPDADAGKTTISAAGGTAPVWSRDGSELFYWEEDRLVAVPVSTSPSFSRGTPVVLFETTNFLGGAGAAPGRTYDVAPDGRFVMVKTAGDAVEQTQAPQITVVLDWFEELKARVPVP